MKFGGEMLHHPNAAGRFARNRFSKEKAARILKGLGQAALNDALDAEPHVSKETLGDIAQERKHRIQRYLQLQSAGQLTPKWKEFGQRHGNEIIAFQLGRLVS